MVRVGLIGCGTIGTQLALALERTYARTARLVALHDIDRSRALALHHRLRIPSPVVSLPRLLQTSQLILEAASVDAAAAVVRRALRQDKDILIMSVGGLLLDDRWRRLAHRSRGHVYVPSGALAGLDGIKAMAVGRIRRIALTTRKPPRALALERLTRPSIVFEGSPRQVIRAFPQNTNVAAALALAGGTRTRVRVRVVADPRLRANIHEVDVEGDCGRIQCRIESRPSANPKTSELAVRSAIATLGRIFDPISIGT